jgi:hypothetical protein
MFFLILIKHELKPESFVELDKLAEFVEKKSNYEN